MDELISRQAAIDAIVNCTNCSDEKNLRAYVAKHSLENGWTGGILDAIDAIKGCPPAQPEERTKTHAESHARDTIYRQAAIDAAALSAAEWDGMYVQDINGRIREALEKLPPAQPDVPDTNVGDMISRQAAIDAVKKHTFRLTFAEEQNCEGHVAWSANAVYSDVIEGVLLELPSAQPEKRTEERTETRACDCISRQAAIDAISCDITVTGRQNAELVAKTIESFADRIKALPVVEPRAKGEWVKEYWNGEHTRKCSACNITQTVTTYRGKVNFNYCPYCGADMRGKKDG